ncbi:MULTISPECIES: hypothetical protein [unclassified Paraburkholderia]|uniref:hypothetical protein n=1 Tax=unclassified Paraburkholderia TaxID=2615204 RepID=UPI002AB282BF|nr:MULTISPECIES: hypothetical protein [unclassified Paraburkholderia]
MPVAVVLSVLAPFFAFFGGISVLLVRGASSQPLIRYARYKGSDKFAFFRYRQTRRKPKIHRDTAGRSGNKESNR